MRREKLDRARGRARDIGCRDILKNTIIVTVGCFLVNMLVQSR